MTSYLTIHAYTPKTNVYNNFKSSKDIKKYQTINKYRYHKLEENDLKTDIAAFSGAAIGTILPMLYFAKRQNRKFYNLKFGLKEMVGISTGSIAGGVALGIASGEKRHTKQKINEGVFQYLNATIPPVLVAVGLKVLDVANKATMPNKIGAIATGLILGMPLAAELSNKINDPYDKTPDRKLTFKDALANIDDAFGALALAKVPAIDKIPFEKLIPVIYTFCGYRAGESN